MQEVYVLEVALVLSCTAGGILFYILKDNKDFF